MLLFVDEDGDLRELEDIVARGLMVLAAKGDGVSGLRIALDDDGFGGDFGFGVVVSSFNVHLSLDKAIFLGGGLDEDGSTTSSPSRASA